MTNEEIDKLAAALPYRTFRGEKIPISTTMAFAVRIVDLKAHVAEIEGKLNESNMACGKESARVGVLEEVARRIVTARGHELEVIARMELPAILPDQSGEGGS